MRHQRLGFTLIELLVVIVVIGILAAIAIPRFREIKGKAYMASMKSDLRHLAIAEEVYLYSHQTYTTELDSLEFTPSPGVIITIPEADGTGWGATSTHPNAYPHLCSIFFGEVAPVAPATSAGQVACQ
ncbi:MAG TPA: prepilin-type N-terminal cleavage/methylation domain-containing protein [Gemmatimonadaceae bacterium]|jgi:prepilin-type N-terminal cleavage/methylation domain-containing protein|nr:prepilin-type N-terminal cleavage/methylation domain-containing protein [Gemmatimonadaceae bacterium]